jgi:hypothetical protein
MALLARRRSGQAFNPRPEDIGIATLGLPAIPDDYDPRIRGKLFHDFSAPRPRPNTLNGKDASQAQDGRSQDRAGHVFQDGHRQVKHTPLFKEHFDDDQNVSRVKSTGYMEIGIPFPPPDRDPPPVPSFAKISPTRLPDAEETRQHSVDTSSAAADSGGNSSALEAKISAACDTSFRSPSGLPKHLTSSASRFSFDMGGVDSSSQEKLLEDKHKEKEAAKRAKAQQNQVNDTDSEDLDYGGMMDDDGLEERIPGINADSDEDEGFLGTEHFSRPPPILVPVLLAPYSDVIATSVAQHAQESTQSEELGSLNAPGDCLITGPSPSSADFVALSYPLPSQNGVDVVHVPEDVSPQYDSRGQFVSLSMEDEDLYFDDGMIEDIPPGLEDDKFDEAIFDDETSHLYVKKPGAGFSLWAHQEEQQRVDNSRQQADATADNVPLKDRNRLKFPRSPRKVDARKGWYSGSLVGQGMHIARPNPCLRGLTKDNLEAYHSALALAANEAAVNGRFERSMSMSDESVEQESVSQTGDSHPGLTSDESRVSQTVDTMGFEDFFEDFNFNDDDGLDDDPIIAAANAEALENDDEGFYGQEFGFYAHSNGNCHSEPVLGGYFGPRGVEGITRSHSGRANFQEPTLTPITERSEWSTRNSIISLTTHGAVHSNTSLSNPPLAQLVDMVDIEDEMTLSALMKLRRGAWGGSNGSLRSSAASQGVPSSPQIPQSTSNLGSFSSFHEALTDQTCSGSGALNMNSPSEAENGALHPSDSDYSPAGLALRCDSSFTGKSVEHCQPQLSIDTANAGAEPGRTFTDGKMHSRSNSAAESVSYVKETDEAGSDHWVLEKRRIAESGESEIVEREVMPYGRI